MQSGYGGVSEIQQFMVDGCPPSLFSISPPPPPPPPDPMAAAGAAEIQHHQQKFYHLPHPQPQYHHHQQQQPPSPPMPPHFSNLIHPIPITQQLFHHPHPHQFQLFQQHHHHNLGLDLDSAPEAPNSPAPPRPQFLAPAMNFKLGVNESSANDQDHDGILNGDDGSESRLHSWHREEESAATIKQPFWRPLDRDYINRNNKRPNSPENNNSSNYSKKSREAVLIEQTATTAAAAVPAAAIGSNYKLFSELEAICKSGNGGIVCGGSTPNNNQTGSGSALTTSDDNPLLPEPAPCPTAVDGSQPEHGSDTSRSGDAAPPAGPPSSSIKKSQKGSSGSSSRRKQRAKRRQEEQMSMIAAFFESLVKRVMDHQESLHCKFLEVMERRDQERTGREEAWRKQEAARNASKAASRAQERALAASREASIISFLEKITGESIDLPKSPFDKYHKDDQECNALDLYNVDGGNNSITNSTVHLNTSRWPKVEVEALIRVRSGLETRFQEPGLKGPLWEEVSSMMAAIGYQRSAKRCKEKWENINKYFRKTKDSGKKRPQHSKTCPYFHQLDQLYSKSSTAPSSSDAGVGNGARKENSELLDAIVVSNDHQQSYKFPDVGSTRTGIDGNDQDQGNEAGSSAMAGKSHGNYEEDEDDDNEEGIEREEGEGDSQEQEHEQEGVNRDDQNEHLHHLHHGLEDPQHDSTFFFQRLRS